MDRFLFLAAVVLFFFAAVGVTAIPHPTEWAFVALALGLAISGIPIPWKKP